MRSRRFLAALGTAALAGALLAGCGSSGDTARMDGATTAEMPVAEAPMMEGAPMQDAAAPVADRSVIRTAYLSMRVPSVPEAIDEVRALVARRDGVISSESLSTGSPGGYATITAQVPADDLTTFLDEVGALGTVDTLDVTAQDVTTQVIDLDARIAVLESSIARLTDLLDQAERVEDIVAVEAELSARQAELDSLTAQRDYLAEQVALSTVTITLSPVTQVADVDSPGFLSGLETGWSAFVALIGFGITALGFLVPFLIVAAVVLIPVTVLLVRRSRRPRRVNGWDASGDSAAPVGNAPSSSSSSSSPS
jgi:Domain of unknown function (DUF4349)